MTYAEGNVGLAFGLVFGAGLATCLGSCVVFCTSLANLRMLAGCLGLSVGVMLYVSFAEIFCVKSVEAFVEFYADDPDSEGKALRMATFCFFSGMIVIAALNGVVQLLEGLASSSPAPAATMKAPSSPEVVHVRGDAGSEDDEAEQGIQEKDYGSQSCCHDNNSSIVALSAPDEIHCSGLVKAGDAEKGQAGSPSYTPDALEMPEGVKQILEQDEVHAGLSKMGLLSGLAIAIHNFPEGLATFVAALAEPKAGAALAIATALHNIPEGICVAMPVYYATGSKWKGFFWSLLSGITEPIGGLVAYLILWNSVTPLTYAIMFGLVGGMMVYISLRDLMPTALRYDPKDNVTTICVFSGMAVMAASLLIFTV